MSRKRSVFVFLMAILHFGGTLRTETFGSNTVLDPQGDLKLRWDVNYIEKNVSFKITISKNIKPWNWFAVGFSDRGEFEHADICLFWVDYLGNAHFEDTHTDSSGRVHVDRHFDCKDFYLNLKRREIGFTRPFDTYDSNDYIIEDGTTHIIWAYGTDTLYTPEGLQPQRNISHNEGFTRVRLLIPKPLPTPTDAVKLSLTVRNLKVPSADTTYWCKVFRLPKFVTRKPHHIVKYESAIKRGNEGLVHHIELFYCDAEEHTPIPLYEGSCFSRKKPNITNTCSKVKAAWAMGAPPFQYPQEAGLPLGGPMKNPYVMLEVHYNNPEKKSDWIDSSGVSLYVTSKLRKYDAAILELGLEYIDKMAIPPGQKKFTLDGYCLPECTEVGIPSSGIVAFGSQLHTHLTGIQVRTRHFRAGKELPVFNQDKHYSTHFQEIRILRRPVLVLPGDFLITSCDYNTLERSQPTIGGHAITDEMCVNYVHYYPASDLEICKSSISTSDLRKYFEFEGTWEGMNVSQIASPRENYNMIKPWNELRVEALHNLYDESRLSMLCKKSDGTRFQGIWDDIPIPKVHKYQEIKSTYRQS